MTMFDKKLYVETFSALHASEDTLAEIRKLTPHGIRPAVLLTALLVFLLSFAALAAGSRRMGGWVHHASVRSVEKMGLSCPNRLGEYRLSGPSPFRRIHAAPEESSGLKAWLDPDYTWMSAEYQNEAGHTVSVMTRKRRFGSAQRQIPDKKTQKSRIRNRPPEVPARI